MKKFLVIGTMFLAAALSAAQSLAVTDSNIELRPAAWKMHNPTDGSQIGGVQPINYGTTFEPAGTSGMQLYVEGPSWATMMTYTQRQLFFPQPDHIQLDFDVDVLDDHGALLETDIMAVVPVPNTSPQTYTLFNMSLQDLYSTGNLMYVNSSGPWAAIPGATPGRLLVGKHHYSITGGWNLAANTYGLTSVAVDAATYKVNQSAVGHPTTWSPGISLQFQISNAPLGSGASWGSTSVIVSNVVLQQISK